MKTIVITLAFTGAVMLLSGCVITPPGENHHHHHNSNTITRDGVTLPNCETLPDASQADNGSRCWYR